MEINKGPYKLMVDLEKSFIVKFKKERKIDKFLEKRQSLLKNADLLECKFVTDRKTIQKDFHLGFASAPVINNRTMELLRSENIPNTEFVPIGDFRGESYFLLNVLNYLSCLDYENSIVTFSPDDPDKVIFIEKYVFDDTEFDKNLMFKIPESCESEYIFVNNRFVELLLEHKLKGLFVLPPFVELFNFKPLFGTPLR